ncbi:MAG: DNA polymerase domain-containing protein [Promethearchaeota archaeon]
MASPRKGKKKKDDDQNQTSLFSFVDEKEKEKKDPVEKDEKTEIKEQSKELIEVKPPVKEEKIEKSPKIEKKVTKKPSQLTFYTKNNKPFGLNEGKIKLDKVLREGVTSKYIRYLIENGEIIENLEQGLLLDVDYDGGLNKAFCKFYDLATDEIKIWVDTTDHEPYCLSNEQIGELEKLYFNEKTGQVKQKKKLTDYIGFKRFEAIKKFDLLRDKEIQMTKLYGETPTNIGGSGTNLRNILGENERKAWEADIRYHLNYIFDRQLIPGLIYQIKNGSLVKLDYEKIDEESKTMANELRDLFKSESTEIQEFSEKFLDIFITPIPDVKRMAMDIEVKVGENDYRIPDPRLSRQEVISISFVATDGLKLVYMLEREEYSVKEFHADFPSDAKVVLFKSEKDLMIETFRLMWKYPVIITFNGDNFDLNYLYHRAEKLKVNKDLNPIHVKRGFGIMSKAECEIRSGIHIDVFNLFFNRSISGYAFGGVYESASLNAISAALLGEEKYQHEELIHEMEFDILSWYNLKDSLLTLELTKFNNSLVWNLIVLLCRITKMPIHDMVRRQISTWIQNIFYFEHRRKNYLIPRRSEISDFKKGGRLMSRANDEKFQGAYVIQPVPGIHFDVVVMDFACFSDDTEVLTSDGWFKYEKLKDYEKNHLKVVTVNPEDNKIEYNPINQIFEYDYKGEMINFKQHGIDILVTPNHRMVYNKRTNERELTTFETKISIKRADELKSDYIYAIPYTGNWEGENFDIHIGSNNYKPSDFLPFLGWFITDGGISGRSVNIYQSKKYNFDHIRSSLEKLGLQYKEYERSRTGKKPEKIFSIHNVSFRDSLKNWFKDNIGEYKRNRIPQEVFKSKKEDLFLLFESMLLGDGRWSGNKCYTFDSLDKDMANDFQILCLKLGYGCTIKEERVNSKFGDKEYKRINYRCLISYERKNIIRNQHTTSVDYQGKVWCLSVKNATIIVRRKGKPFVSGNSLYPSIIKEYNLSYETVLCPHKDDEDNLVKGTPYHICTHKMGIFAYVVGFFRDIRVKYFKPKSGDKQSTEKQRNYYQTIQQALKVFINGSYGVFGSQNFPLFCLPVAESTTGIGQYSIKETIKKAETLGIKVLYGDTDSVFLLNPSQQQMGEITMWSKKELDLDLEEEKTYQFLALSERKKNYIGIYKNSKYTDIKGLVAKKKNTPEFIKKAFSEMIEILKTITNNEEFVKAKDEIIEIVRDNLKKIGKTNTFALEDYAINIGLQKDLKNYTKTIPQHVRAARELRDMTGRTFQKGETISFIKSKGTSGAKAIELAKLQDLDIKKYKDLLKSAFEQVLDALGITFDEIKGIKKMDAFF